VIYWVSVRLKKPAFGYSEIWKLPEKEGVAEMVVLSQIHGFSDQLMLSLTYFGGGMRSSAR
jgi:hypothetical protein